MDKIKQLEKEWAPVKPQEAFKAGDTITVHYRISEGSKERIQQYQGVVIQRKGSGSTATFTVRKMSGAVGVERIFPIASPFLDKVEVNKRGDVNRARIFYIRERRGKSARIKEKRMSVAQEQSNASAKAKSKKTDTKKTDTKKTDAKKTDAKKATAPTAAK